MKVFNLSCQLDHTFEGWFASLDAFDAQRESQLVRCPLCNSTEVRRLPSASRLNLGAAAPAPVHTLSEAQRFFHHLGELIAQSEDVGDRFAEEARRIHYAETQARSIRGVATHEERQALEDEGIDVLPLPAVLRPKGSLQ